MIARLVGCIGLFCGSSIGGETSQVDNAREFYDRGYPNTAFGILRELAEDSSKKDHCRLEALDAIENHYRSNPKEHKEAMLEIAENIARDIVSNVGVRLAGLRLILLFNPPDKKEDMIERVVSIVHTSDALSIKEVSEAFAQGFVKDIENERKPTASPVGDLIARVSGRKS